MCREVGMSPLYGSSSFRRCRERSTGWRGKLEGYYTDNCGGRMNDVEAGGIWRRSSSHGGPSDFLGLGVVRNEDAPFLKESSHRTSSRSGLLYPQVQPDNVVPTLDGVTAAGHRHLPSGVFVDPVRSGAFTPPTIRRPPPVSPATLQEELGASARPASLAARSIPHRFDGRAGLQR